MLNFHLRSRYNDTSLVLLLEWPLGSLFLSILGFGLDWVFLQGRRADVVLNSLPRGDRHVRKCPAFSLSFGAILALI